MLGKCDRLGTFALFESLGVVITGDESLQSVIKVIVPQVPASLSVALADVPLILFPPHQ